jgi:CheY-like chemotaxis protein
LRIDRGIRPRTATGADDQMNGSEAGRGGDGAVAVTRDAPHARAGDGPLRVLVVDDNEDSALSLAMLLEMQGHAVTTAFRGSEALQKAVEEPPDVALLDIGLPDMNGYELARRLRSSPGATPLTLVALTGWGQDEDRRAAEGAGFDHHFTKPVDPDALEQLLQQLKLG